MRYLPHYGNFTLHESEDGQIINCPVLACFVGALNSVFNNDLIVRLYLFDKGYTYLQG